MELDSLALGDSQVSQPAVGVPGLVVEARAPEVLLEDAPACALLSTDVLDFFLVLGCDHVIWQTIEEFFKGRCK